MRLGGARACGTGGGAARGQQYSDPYILLILYSYSIALTNNHSQNNIPSPPPPSIKKDKFLYPFAQYYIRNHSRGIDQILQYILLYIISGAGESVRSFDILLSSYHFTQYYIKFTRGEWLRLPINGARGDQP